MEATIINIKNCKERQIISCVNSLRWDKNISLETKKVVTNSYSRITNLLWIGNLDSSDIRTELTPRSTDALFKKIN